MASQLDLGSIVVVVPNQVSADLGGEAVVLGLEKSMYYGLDGVGSRVWELIKQPQAVSSVRDTILDEYEVDRETCERDLLEFLGKLAAEGLIEVKDDEPA